MRNKAFTFDAFRGQRGYRRRTMAPIVPARIEPRGSRTAAMTDAPSPLEMIRANADMVLAVARDEFGQGVGYDEAGVRWLNGYIQALVDQGGVEASEDLCDRLGSFLGTCIIETYGGSWRDTEYGWAVVVKDDFAVFPFNKTLKHLTEGAGDSLLGLFTGIPAIMDYAGASPDGDPQSTSASASRGGSIMSKLGSLFRRR